jgi:hypothetical protein
MVIQTRSPYRAIVVTITSVLIDEPSDKRWSGNCNYERGLIISLREALVFCIYLLFTSPRSYRKLGFSVAQPTNLGSGRSVHHSPVEIV